jgi:hypothetical protein
LTKASTPTAEDAVGRMATGRIARRASRGDDIESLIVPGPPVT